VRAEIGQPRARWQGFLDEVAHYGRQHGLAAVREIAQPSGPVDRRPRVVAVVAQYHLAGVDTDAQTDRGQWSALQGECARDGIAGSSECGDETIALALFHRPHPTVAGDQFRHDAISRSTASAMATGSASHKRVEPSTSASSSVTVPVGSNSLTPNSLQSVSLMLASLTCCRAKNISDIAHSYDPLHCVYDPTVPQLRAGDRWFPAAREPQSSHPARKVRTP